MLYRTIAALVLIGVTYTLGVFFLPKETDEIAALFGIEGLNENIRSLKLGADRVST